ncbi:MAG: carboxypeptidase-like regulatory domain-containing protein, partial [Flavobacterium sp.]|nr:carboxypeptidase-like regulatory domain-containing protein [Flavobacterium sp.]
MNSKIFLLLFVFATQFLFSQETNPTITLEFSNQSTKTVLDKIETLSKYRFYYDEKWLPKNLISGNYEGKSIEYILNKIAENTELNFFFDQEKIILTKNKMIYKSLPKNYFTKSGDENTASNKPILNDIDALKSGNLTFIGKETLNNTEDTYTLTGNLKNLKNGLPLNDVIVSNKSNKKTTVSDADGNYSIQANYGENTIEFEGQGMQKQTRKIIVYNNGQLDVALSEKINLLNEIVVKGKRRNNIRAAITGVTTIEAEGVKTVPLV